MNEQLQQIERELEQVLKAYQANPTQELLSRANALRTQYIELDVGINRKGGQK